MRVVKHLNIFPER